MRYFITSETTVDVTADELRILKDFEHALNRVASDLQIEGIELVGIVLVVMDPAIVPPFPPGLVVRRASKELDIKPAIGFGASEAAEPAGRVELLIDAIRALFAAQPRKRVSDQAISDLEDAFGRGLKALCQ